jgi:rhamnosyl/mannosyltransferase
MIGKYFPPVRGGIEEYTLGLADAIGDSVELTVLVHAKTKATTRERRNGYDVVRIATPLSISSQPLSPAMIPELRASSWDIIHVHVPNVQGVALALAFAGDARIVVTHHADMVGFGPAGAAARLLYRQLLKRASAVTVLSLKNRELARDIGSIDIRCEALPLAVDPRRFSPTARVLERAMSIRAAAGETRMLLAFVGRLVPYKGLDVLIRALAGTPGVSCLIVGEGGERSRLEALSAECGTAERIRFLGPLDEEEKHAVLRACDAFVLPSINTAEAFGIVQVEAQLCGLPVIATDLPTGVTDVTRHGETGLVVPPGDAEALAGAIERLAGDCELRARLGEAGLARALSTYSPDALRDRAVRLYRGILAD